MERALNAEEALGASAARARQQLLEMLSLQDTLNSGVHADWRAQGFEWTRAIWVECAELMDHCAYKWWKAQQIDQRQVQLEVVDIWHFGISHLLTRQPPKDIASRLLEDFSQTLSEVVEIKLVIEEVARGALVDQRFDLSAFCQLMVAAELSFQQLYQIYIAKNTLNIFRHEHGYASGAYQKIWAGREDNEHLAEIVEFLDSANSNYKSQLYSALEARYEQSINDS